MNTTLLADPCAPATQSTSVKPANNKALTSIDIQKRKPSNRVNVKQFKILPEMTKRNDCRRKALVTYDRPLQATAKCTMKIYCFKTALKAEKL